jgi:dolichyl-phosphate-mannose-protein mannosyltransferase
MIAGAVLSFILSETVNHPISVWGPTTRARPKQFADLGIKAPIIFVGFCVAMIAVLLFFAPLTYGTPGYVFYPDLYAVANIRPCSLTGEQVNARRLLSTWTLHFAAKVTAEVVL